jgi:hypothetical protein
MSYCINHELRSQLHDESIITHYALGWPKTILTPSPSQARPGLGGSAHQHSVGSQEGQHFKFVPALRRRAGTTRKCRPNGPGGSARPVPQAWVASMSPSRPSHACEETSMFWNLELMPESSIRGAAPAVRRPAPAAGPTRRAQACVVKSATVTGHRDGQGTTVTSHGRQLSGAGGRLGD